MISGPTLDALKAADPDRLRAAVFADKAGRARLAVLYAFHHELAKVPEIVSEPMLGEIRYQWWRDVVEEIYAGKTVRQHEVTTPLSEMLLEVDMPRFWVERLIDGRARDLDPTPFADMDVARGYCRQTSGVLMQMAAKCLAPDVDDEMVLQAGIAWGLTGLVRGWSFYEESLLKNLSRNDLLEAARETYNDTARRPGKLSPNLLPAIAYTALIPGFLKRHAVTPPQTYSPLAKQGRLLLTSMTARLPA